MGVYVVEMSWIGLMLSRVHLSWLILLFLLFLIFLIFITFILFLLYLLPLLTILPHRPPKVAAQSKLSQRPHTPSDIEAMLSDFAPKLSSMLLFLKHVCRIRIFTWGTSLSASSILATNS